MMYRHLIVAAVLAASITGWDAAAVCDSTAGNATAEIFAEYCEPDLGYIGCCFGTEAFWCETSLGQQYTCKIECASAQYCGWNTEQGYYFCGTDGSADPTQENPLTCPDADGDGWHLGGDCDDSQGTVYPEAPFECDGLDNDCDSEPDTNEADADGDGYSECDGDCNDALPEFNPGAEDECGDGYDHDCSGDVDQETDDDGDGQAECEGDCDDTDASVHSDAQELCGDGIDNDCDSDIDEDCGTEGDDDDSQPSGDDDDESMVSPRAGPYGLACSQAPDRAGLPVGLGFLVLGLLIRRKR